MTTNASRCSNQKNIDDDHKMTMPDTPEKDGTLQHNKEELPLIWNGKVSPQDATKYIKAILVVSWLSVILLGILGITALAQSVMSESSAGYGFTCDAILDVISSAIIIWRYFRTEPFYSESKDLRACIIMGILTEVSAVFILGKSLAALAYVHYPDTTDLTWYYSVLSAVACTFLFTSKFYLGYKLGSILILTDGMTSLIGAVLSFTIIISSTIYKLHKGVWFLDAIIGIVCAIFLGVYGTWVLINSSCKNRTKKPTCTLQK